MNPLLLLGIVGAGAVVYFATSSASAATAAPAPSGGGAPPSYPGSSPSAPSSPTPTPRVFPPAQPQPVGVSPLPYWPDNPVNWPLPGSAPATPTPTPGVPPSTTNPDGTVTLGDITYVPPTSGPSTPGWTPPGGWPVTQSHLRRFAPGAGMATSPTQQHAVHAGAFYDPMSARWYGVT